MKQLLRACGLILGFSAPILCAPSGPPAGNYIQNISTNALTQIFKVSSGTVTGQITVGSCALIGGGSCGSGGGSGGSQIYPATATPSFPFGISATTGVFNSTLTAVSLALSGSGWPNFTPADGNAYNLAGSSATPVTVGHVPVYTSTGGVIGDSGLTPGSGGGGGTPGGSDTQVQYDSAGVFAGSALETFVPSSSPTAINFNNVSSVTYSGFPSIVASTGVLIDFSTDSVLTGYLYASSFTIIASTPTLYDNHGNKLLYETWNESNLYAGALTGNTTGTGNNNTAMGYQTFAFDTTGSNNTIYGYDAGQDITVGSNNVYSGIQSGYFAAQGSNNTAVGASSLYANTYGSNNTAVGYYTLSTSTAATANSAVGYGALQNVTSSSNTAVGYTALLLESTGYMNVGVGFDAGYDEQGSSNVYIGANAGPAGASNLQNSVAIGYGVIASSSNAVVIGNTSVTTMVLNGNVNLSTATFTGQTFATLGTAANGTFEYCSDCTVTTPSTCVGVISAACVCAGSGSGAFAKRLNATWYCN